MKDQRVYLRDMLDRIERIEEYTRDGREAFEQSRLIQDGVVRSFEVIGEVVKRLSDDLKAKHPDIPWRRIAGFRDVLIHDYDEVLTDEVWRVVEVNLQPLKHVVEQLLTQLEQGDDTT